MEEISETKSEIRANISQWFKGLSADKITSGKKKIEERLLDFANYVESNIVLFYTDREVGISSLDLIRESLKIGKIVVLPEFDGSQKFKIYKIDHVDTDIVDGLDGFKPNTTRCKEVPIECIDIAIVPAVALDEKGGRIGCGLGRYDRLIPRLPITTRKVSLAYEGQIISQVPMESHDKYTDIIITEKRVIYKI